MHLFLHSFDAIECGKPKTIQNQAHKYLQPHKKQKFLENLCASTLKCAFRLIVCGDDLSVLVSAYDLLIVFIDVWIYYVGWWWSLYHRLTHRWNCYLHFSVVHSFNFFYSEWFGCFATYTTPPKMLYIIFITLLYETWKRYDCDNNEKKKEPQRHQHTSYRFGKFIAIKNNNKILQSWN